MKNRVIIFYDGDCGFCNAWVNFFLKRNPGFLYFTSLQGVTAKTVLGEDSPFIKNLSTLVVLTLEQKVKTQSSAALYAFSCLPWPWKIMGYFIWVPKFIRDAAYRLVARTRYVWGIKNYCVAPRPHEKHYFLE